MRQDDIRIRRRQRAHQLLSVCLISLLVAFSLWSLWLLARAQRLRGELDLYFGWIDELHAMHGELDDLQDGGDDEARAGARFEEYRDATEELLRQSQGPELRVAVQNLRRALAELPRESGGAASDALWQASVAAQSAAAALEGEIRRHVTHLHQRLDGHWRSLRLLVAGVLLLAATNLLLLFVIHRRRLELEGANVRLLRYARHDPLTGLWNREGILRLLSHELVRAGRSQAPLGVILADLDNFKAVNDLIGHDQGDYVLQQVGQRLQSLVRPYDTLGRFGGDSFLVVLPACSAAATERVAQRLLRAFDERGVEHALGRIRVTLNMAQTTVDRAAETDVDTLLHKLQERVEASPTS